MSLTIRRPGPADLYPLAQFIAVTEALDGDYLTEDGSRSPTVIQAKLAAEAARLVAGCWLAQVETGQVIGYNQLEAAGGPEGLNFWLHGAVHSDWQGRGIGRELIRRSWADMRQQCAQVNPQPAFVNAWAYQHDTARCRLFARFGLQPYHVYHELVIPAQRIKATPPLPAGLIIRPWVDSHCAAAAKLRNEAFTQNWGYQPTTPEALRRHFARGRYEPAYSFTAWRQVSPTREQMVGLVHGCLGWTRKLRQTNEGEIVWLAVAEEARRQGIGQILMLTVMHALHAAGAEQISVSADNHADHPAIGLYTRLGFTIRKAVVDYRGKV